jgi:hypothetical protein
MSRQNMSYYTHTHTHHYACNKIQYFITSNMMIILVIFILMVVRLLLLIVVAVRVKDRDAIQWLLPLKSIVLLPPLLCL